MALTKAEKKLLSKLGRKNGKRRLVTMTSEQRIAAARHAANKRWEAFRKAQSKPEAAA